MKCSLGISSFLEEICLFPSLFFSSISLHWSLRKAFLSLPAVLWNSAFRCLYLSFSPLLFASSLFTAICKASKQIWPCNTEWNRAKANRVLPREHTGHRKHHLPTTQKKTLYMDITRWSTPKSDWLYSLQPKMEKLYTVSKNKTWIWLWLGSWTPYCQIQTEIEESRENH